MTSRPITRRHPTIRIRRAACIAFTALLVLTASIGRVPSSAHATMPGHSGRIIFQDGATGQLFTVNPDGTALRQVTHEGYNATPDWSPDGRRIAYASNRSGTFQIWIAAADGSSARQLTSNNPDAKLFPRFTPDGRTVVYQDCLGDGCDGGISAVRTDGSHLPAITPNSGTSYNWAVPSPGGRQLAFMRWHVAGIKMRIFVMPFRGGPERPITPARLEAWAPDWAPNGGRIVFSSNLFSDLPHGAIYTVRPDGTDLRPLTNPPWPLEDFEASYAPDGNRLVFSSDRRYPDRCCADLYLMNNDGHAVQRIPLATTQAVYARWGTAPLLKGGEPYAATTPHTKANAAGQQQLCALVPTPGLACPAKTSQQHGSRNQQIPG